MDLQRDLWTLVFATHPDQALALFEDRNALLSDPARRRLDALIRTQLDA
ncbi:hypothetical protein O1L60_40790 [Streptomyces diastatochromogenes]|nr:hypothetical protein [Streptomyces diastatochromogenes]